MSERTPLEALDELERRRRRDYDAVRRWILGTTDGHGGPISAGASDVSDNDQVAVLLTYREVAGVLGTSETTVKRLVLGGQLPTVRLAPRVVRVRRTDLDRFVSDLEADDRTTPTPTTP